MQHTIRSIISTTVVLAVLLGMISIGYGPTGLVIQECPAAPKKIECEPPKLAYPTYTRNNGCLRSWRCVNSALIQGGKEGVECPVVKRPNCRADQDIKLIDDEVIKLCVKEMICVDRGCRDEAIIGPPCRKDEKKELKYSNETKCATHWICVPRKALNRSHLGYTGETQYEYEDPENRLTITQPLNMSGNITRFETREEKKERIKSFARIPEYNDSLTRISKTFENFTGEFEDRYKKRSFQKQMSLREKRRQRQIGNYTVIVTNNSSNNEVTETAGGGLNIPDCTIDANMLISKIRSCSSYKCQYGTNLTREVIGMDAGKCQYTEQVSSGMMNCSVSEETRHEIADYVEKILEDEEPHTNPIYEAIMRGDCVVS